MQGGGICCLHGIFERIGAYLNYVYQRQLRLGGAPLFPTGFTVTAAQELANISEQELASLQQYGGSALVEEFQRTFDGTQLCGCPVICGKCA